MKYNVGDRVRALPNAYGDRLPAGIEGTVVDASDVTYVEVRWDGDPFASYSDDNNWPMRHGEIEPLR